MSSGLAAQNQGGSLRNAEGASDAPGMPLMLQPNAQVIPSKRSDDDVQFISSNPVKRQRISVPRFQPGPALTLPSHVQLHQHGQPQNAHISYQHNPGAVHSVGIVSVAGAASDHPHDPAAHIGIGNNEAEKSLNLSHDRRVSTGMVGLPSDPHDMDPSLGLRGVSLPVLENFVLNQPLRKPKPPSPPALSPKQLPATISPTLLNVNMRNAENSTTELNGPHRPNGCFSGGASAHTVVEAQPSAPEMAGSLMVIDSPATPNCPPASAPPVHADGVNSSTPRSPSLRVNPGAISNCQQQTISHGNTCNPNTGQGQATMVQQQTSHMHGNSNPNSTSGFIKTNKFQKPPCLACMRQQQQLQQAAAMTRTQGLPMPMMQKGQDGHMFSPIHTHMPCNSGFVAMPPNMRGFGTPFGPIMMPYNMSAFSDGMPPAGMPPSQSSGPSMRHTLPQKPVETNQVPATTVPDAKPAPSNSSPCKPPASLPQPNIRKPSPNLLLDVAETSQQTFPFEEVAKRHNVPVDKVFEVFAAIIQMPLLRATADRRRAPREATSRVKEYTKAKKDIQETRSHGGVGGNKDEIVVRPIEIAQYMGPIELPHDFTMPGHCYQG